MDDAKQQKILGEFDSRGFRQADIEGRLELLVKAGLLSADEAAKLADARQGLPHGKAVLMIENTFGVFGFPVGLAINFVVNDKRYLVPMVIEEPSVVAAANHIARLVADSGGFTADADESVMIGQMQVVECPDQQKALEAINAERDQLIKEADENLGPIRDFGGKVHDIEARILSEGDHPMMVLHFYVDTRDAMGANTINTLMENMSGRIEKLTGGRVLLRILSNLADRRLARASCRIPLSLLDWHGYTGEQVARGIEHASRFAELDPYRATTHNKGVMNGIDAVVLATGNDWRAIEAGAHAYAARNGSYEPLSTWRVDGDALTGKIELPLALGVVGGQIKNHPQVGLLMQLMGSPSSRELAMVIAAVGLAQNLAAIKALATEGIQRGHMSLHARSVAASAGAEGALAEEIARELVKAGDISLEKAKQLIAERKG